MLQVMQRVRGGKPEVRRVPDPAVRAGHVLIANQRSLISAGTERMVIELAQKSLLGKARERPDQVRRVLEKVRTEGMAATVGQVREKLGESIGLGYSSAGVVLACGLGVEELAPGDRVASNGPHAGVVCVPRNLCARVPDAVSSEHAAFAVVGSIALQGVRLAGVELGGTALVIGLGLIGQITVALLRAAGVRVLGTDPDQWKCETARRMGAEVARSGLTAADVEALTVGLGADSVLITASTDSNGPIELAAGGVRKKGRIVLVGVVGLQLDRRPFYFKECELVVSCSYGPGRYDPRYEERGIDYPAAYVRWTEQRNIQAVLDLMAAGSLDVSPLLTHRFPVEQAPDAYELVESGREPYLGIVLEYPEAVEPERRVVLESGRASRAPGSIGVGVLGAGNFARLVMLPALMRDPRVRPVAICSAGGSSASEVGARLGFGVATSDEAAVLSEPGVEAVFALTRHDQHARQVVAAIEAGKHVFVEKPLALTLDEVEAVEAALAGAESPPLVMVGFNRRFSPAAAAVRRHFADVPMPKVVSIRFNAGAIPPEHWTQDPEVGGGRIIGEACHAIDLATFLVGSPPVRVFAEAIGGANAPEVRDDQAVITLRHADGSVSTVVYTAGGDRALAKERVEVFGGGRAAVIDDFRAVELVAGGRVTKPRMPGQDKGHRAEVSAFLDAVEKGGPWPIPWTELRAVSLASILAVRSLREGLPMEIA